jgi:rare lipoprotein A
MSMSLVFLLIFSLAGRAGAGGYVPPADRSPVPMIAAHAFPTVPARVSAPAPAPAIAAPKRSARRSSIEGIASFYGPGFEGRRTASGEIFDADELTGAHRSLPFGTRVRVTNLQNKKRVVVKITDRGPFVRGRVIDLSHRAAEELGFASLGTVPVRLDVLI